MNILDCITVDFSLPCVFPFEYKGTTYNNCTTAGGSEAKWCATAVSSTGKMKDYGDCSPACDEKSGKKLNVKTAQRWL